MKLIKYLEKLKIYFENNGLDIENIIEQLKGLKETSKEQKEIAGKIVTFRKGLSRRGRNDPGNWIIKNNSADTGEIAHTIFQALTHLNIIDGLIHTAEWKKNPADSLKEIKNIIPGRLTLEKPSNRDEKDGFYLNYDGESIDIKDYKKLEEILEEILEKI